MVRCFPFQQVLSKTKMSLPFAEKEASIQIPDATIPSISCRSTANPRSEETLREFKSLRLRQITAAGQFCDCRTARVATRLIRCSGSYNRQNPVTPESGPTIRGHAGARQQRKNPVGPSGMGSCKDRVVRDLVLVLAICDLLCSFPN